jgi:hypothetical protein
MRKTDEYKRFRGIEERRNGRELSENKQEMMSICVELIVSNLECG